MQFLWISPALPTRKIHEKQSKIRLIPCMRCGWGRRVYYELFLVHKIKDYSNPCNKLFNVRYFNVYLNFTSKALSDFDRYSFRPTIFFEYNVNGYIHTQFYFGRHKSYVVGSAIKFLLLGVPASQLSIFYCF